MDRGIMDIKTSLEKWASTVDNKKEFFSSLELLKNSLVLIEQESFVFSDSEFSILRDVHLFCMRFMLGIGRGVWTTEEDGVVFYDIDLRDLVHRFNFKCLSFNPINYELNLFKKDTLNVKFSEEFSNKYGLSNKTLDENTLSFEVYQHYLRISDIQHYYNSSNEIAFYLFEKSKISKTSPIKSVTFVSTEDLLSCYFYCPQIGETEDTHEKLLNSLFSELEEKLLKEVESIDSVLSANKTNENKKIKPAERLILTNSNASNVIFGKTREKMIAEAKKTPYYLTTYTPDRIKEEQTQIIADWAKETVFKTDKKVLGSLAVMKRVTKEEQTELIKPITSSPVGDFDWDTWSIVHSNLKNYLDVKVDLRFLTTSFSISQRQKKENEYAKEFKSSIGLLSNTWIVYRYYEGTREIIFAEPLLSCNLAKEIDQITGEEYEYFILTSVCKFYERAEKLNQVMSFDEKLFKIEYYDKDGILTKLAQTKKNMILMTHLLEHIFKFKYYYEHPRKTKDGKEEIKGSFFNRISFETLFELLEINNRKSKLSYGRKIEGCFQYWKSLNYIDYEIVKKAKQRGESYDYIFLKYPEDTPKLLS